RGSSRRPCAFAQPCKPAWDPGWAPAANEPFGHSTRSRGRLVRTRIGAPLRRAHIVVISLHGGRMSRFWCIASCAVGLGTLCAFQRPFREFPGIEYRLGDIQLPLDHQEKTEWTFARLMYPLAP